MKNPLNQRAAKKYHWVLIGLLVVLLGVGFLLRMVDLKDPPLGFNPTRQLRSAIIARGIYYANQPDDGSLQRQLATTHWKMMERLEPSVLEWIVASTYRLMGTENVWFSRIYTTIFWTIGAVALYDLARRMTSIFGALIGMGYFLFLPFSILASRSFQPDPGMIMFVILTAWALDRWSDERSWRWAIWVGIFGGAAAFVKVVGAFFVGGVAIGVVIYSLGMSANTQNQEDQKLSLANLKSGLRNPQVWVMAALMILPALAYYVAGSGGSSSTNYANWTIISRWRDVLSLSFFMRWMIRVSSLMEPSLVLAAFVGTFLVGPRSRALLWGFWGSYFLFGLTFPHHITTHDYYHLPLLAVVSLSLPALAAPVINVVRQRGKFIQVMFVMVAVIAALYNGWMGRSILVGQDFSDHPAYWTEVGEAIPVNAKLVGVTQDYGFRLMYYGWRTIRHWPQGAGSENFAERTADADYFVVTATNQLNDELKAYLEGNYPIYAEGVGYIFFNLSP